MLLPENAQELVEAQHGRVVQHLDRLCAAVASAHREVTRRFVHSHQPRTIDQAVARSGAEHAGRALERLLRRPEAAHPKARHSGLRGRAHLGSREPCGRAAPCCRGAHERKKHRSRKLPTSSNQPKQYAGRRVDRPGDPAVSLLAQHDGRTARRRVAQHLEPKRPAGCQADRSDGAALLAGLHWLCGGGAGGRSDAGVPRAGGGDPQIVLRPPVSRLASFAPGHNCTRRGATAETRVSRPPTHRRLQPRVWSYWDTPGVCGQPWSAECSLFNMSMARVQAGSYGWQQSAHDTPADDPVSTNNIMYSAHVASIGLLYEALSGDATLSTDGARTTRATAHLRSASALKDSRPRGRGRPLR
eukprot:6192292-Prymnesium_polylepis.2